MRALSGSCTPREAANARFAFLFIIRAADTIAFVILVEFDAETAGRLPPSQLKQPDHIATFSPG